jgi:hypothetical protein
LVKPIDDIYNLPERAQEVVNGINATFKQVPPATVIESRLRRNITLMFLDHRVIPQEIQTGFKKAYTASQNAEELSAKVYDMAHILEGTRFLSAPKSFEADIFSQFKL